MAYFMIERVTKVNIKNKEHKIAFYLIIKRNREKKSRKKRTKWKNFNLLKGKLLFC